VRRKSPGSLRISMKKFHFPVWTIPPALLILCLISYGLLIPKLGYYWDDWPAIWFTKFFGSSSLIQVLGIDRPQLAWLYFLTTSLIGDSTTGWQLFALLMRWVSCLALWWTLSQLWPKQRNEITWVTFLFAVYPGFRQQYISLIYSQDWIIISLFFLSMGLMIVAVRKAKWFWPLMIISWLLSAYTMFADEYYFGLELLRPVILWLVLQEQIEDRRKRLKRVILLWLPYIGLMVAFLIWRLFIHVSPRGQVQMFDQLASNPFIGLYNLAKTVISDIVESSFLAWSLPFQLKEINATGLTSLTVYFILAVAVSGLTIFFLERLRLSKADPTQPDFHWANLAVAGGVLALFVGGWPFWATAWQIGLTFPWDRFNLAMNLGASLLIAGLTVLIFRKRVFIILVLGVLIGFASANQYHLADHYKQDWQMLQEFFWQMSWRVPGIEPNTAILTNRPPFTYSTDNSLTAPLNWIYAPDIQNQNLPYLFFDIASHFPKGWNSLDPNQPLQQDYRILHFDGSFSRALSVFYRPPNCVKIMDPVIDRELPGKPLYITPSASFSQIDLIELNPQNPAVPPTKLFGPEPAHDWCYFFEKAELARQAGDWATAAILADQALSNPKEMTEANVLEWMPFIEAYARTGKWAEAEKLSFQVYDVHPKMRRMLCSLWERSAANTEASQSRDQSERQIENLLNCSIIDEN
jgi:hypothetical protein